MLSRRILNLVILLLLLGRNTQVTYWIICYSTNLSLAALNKFFLTFRGLPDYFLLSLCVWCALCMSITVSIENKNGARHVMHLCIDYLGIFYWKQVGISQTSWQLPPLNVNKIVNIKPYSCYILRLYGLLRVFLIFRNEMFIQHRRNLRI